MNSNDLITLAHNVGVPIKKLSAQTMATVNIAPHAQLRTAGFKKAVFVVEDLVFKGPYTSDKDYSRLMKNLRYSYAIQILEEALQLPVWQRGSLRWEYIGCWSNNQYHLVAQNVGKWKDIPFELKSSKIEKDVPVVPRGGFVWRFSDVEKNGQLATGVKSAALQHLYIRFLLDIGDSGTHNILIREDNDTTGRLIAGVDLEEKRAIRAKKCRLDHLFKKAPSKRQVHLYQSDVCNIKSLSYGQLDQQTIDSLDAVGIDLERLKKNMKLWDRLT